MSLLNKFGIGPGNGPGRDVSRSVASAAGSGDKSRPKGSLPAPAVGTTRVAPLNEATRVSNGLKELLWNLDGLGRGTLLDLGSAWQTTLSFFIEKGFRVTADGHQDRGVCDRAVTAGRRRVRDVPQQKTGRVPALSCRRFEYLASDCKPGALPRSARLPESRNPGSFCAIPHHKVVHRSRSTSRNPVHQVVRRGVYLPRFPQRAPRCSLYSPFVRLHSANPRRKPET